MKIRVTGVGLKAIKADVNGQSEFYGVKRPVQLSDFEKGNEYEVDIAMNGKFKNIIKVEKSVGVSVQDNTLISAKEIDSEMAKVYIPKKFIKKVEPEKTDWAAKDRSQLVGGRSHDAAQLVVAALGAGVSIEETLKMHREALVGLLKMADEVK